MTTMEFRAEGVRSVRVDCPAIGPTPVTWARVQENAHLVATFAGKGQVEPARSAFLEALEQIQPVHVDFFPKNATPGLSFGPLTPTEDLAFRTVMVVDALPEGWAYAANEHQMLRARVGDALRVIMEVEPDLSNGIDTIVGSFLFAKLDGYEGGSISRLVGAIWLGLPPSKPAAAFAELIVHEYVHQCLFLEDMVRSIFPEGEQRMAAEDGLVTSAILQIPRGYDKAFHSACVSVVLAQFHERLGCMEQARSLLEPLAITLSGLCEKAQFLSRHGLNLLSELVVLADALRKRAGLLPLIAD